MNYVAIKLMRMSQVVRQIQEVNVLNLFMTSVATADMKFEGFYGQ